MEANNYSGNSEYLKGQQVNSTPTFIEDFIGEAFWVYFYKVINKDFNSKSKTISFGSSVKNILFLDTSSPIVKKCYLGSNMVTKANNLNSKQTAQWLFAEQREISFNGIFEELYEYDFFITIGEQISEENKYNSYYVNSATVNTFQKKSEQQSEFGDTVNLDVSQQQVTVTLNNQNVFINASGRTIDLILLKTNQINSIKNKLLSSIKLTAPQQFLPSKVSVKGLNNKNNIIEFDTYMGLEKQPVPFRLEPVSVGQSSYFLAPAFTKNEFRWQDILHAGNLSLTTDFNFYNNFGVSHSAGEEIDVTNGSLIFGKLKGIAYFSKPPSDQRIARFNNYGQFADISISSRSGVNYAKWYAFGQFSGNITAGGNTWVRVTLNDLADVVRYIDNEGNSHTLNPLFIESCTIEVQVKSGNRIVYTGNYVIDSSNYIDVGGNFNIPSGQLTWYTTITINGVDISPDLRWNSLDVLFRFKELTPFKLKTIDKITDNIIGDFIKCIMTIYINYKLGFPNAMFDTNGVDPKNQMAVIKNFVINNNKDIKTTINNMINQFISTHSIELAPYNNQINNSSQFKEKWQSALAFINSIGDVIESNYSMEKSYLKTYNLFYADIYSYGAPTSLKNIAQGTGNIIQNALLFQLIPELDPTKDETIYYFNDLNGSANSEYFNWTPVQSPDDPNIYAITDLTTKSNIINKPLSVFDLNLKTDYMFKELDDSISQTDLNTDPQLINTSKREYQRYNFYVPLTSEQIILFFSNLGSFDNTALLSQKSWIEIIKTYYNNCQFDILFVNDEKIIPSQLEISGIWGGSCVLEFTYVSASGGEQEVITINTDILNPLDESVSQTIYMF